MSSIYLSCDIDVCRRLGHHFKLIGSDKTPLKRSLQCVTCTLQTAKQAYVAYGDETNSWGAWNEIKKNDD